MTTEFDIRRSVARYLGEVADVRALRTELAPLSGSQTLTPEAQAMLRQVEGRLAEFSHGDWTESELKGLLGNFGTMVILSEPYQTVGTNASTEGVPAQREAVTMLS